uniref:Peptidase S1 domain-containing protein n=1 Tax=Anopheles dirus TaxID=7168 RepID=A0A182NP74_9DIPT
MCAGVLVKSTWVLTTAQCVSEKVAADLKVLLGSHRLLTNKKTLNVNAIVRHPSYDSTTGAHNLALLQLSEAAALSERVATIALNDVAITSDVASVFYGWGALSYGSTASSNTLQTLYRRTLSTSDCRARLSSLVDGNVCATGPIGQAACTKDDGGPLVRYDSSKLIGIFSYGTQCSGRLPDVFVDIYIHKSWIDATAV